jgi:DNA-binding transcriptional LysR family regulator
MQNMTFQKLEVFCLTAQLGSVTRAAERLGMAQPVVTAHVRSLETKLGVRLIKRVGRNIALTEAGERVFRWGDEMLTRSRELERELAGLTEGSSGNAVVAASMTAGSYFLPDLLIRFRKTHPSSIVTVQISNPQTAMEAVLAGVCDFAVLLLDPRRFTEEFVIEPLWDEPLLLIADGDSKLVGKHATVDDLMLLPFISTPKNLIRRAFEDDQLRAHGVLRQNVILELGHPEPMKRAVKADLGVSFLLETCVEEELDSGALRIVDTGDIRLSIPLYLAYRKRKDFSPLQRALMQFIRDARPAHPPKRVATVKKARPR